MSKRILIVEDSPTEALKAKLFLEREGYAVSQAADGQAGLAAAAEEKPDLIVLDTLMPRMSGYEAYQLLKVNPQTADIPVLMLMTHNGTTPQPQPLGADTYIGKPYGPQLLLEGVQAATRSRKNGYSDNFLAIMSHELRTPLHELVGMTDLLMTTEMSAEQQQYVNKARISINALSVMVSDLLEFSEMETGQLDLQEQSFDWVEVAEGTAVLLQSRADEKGLTLTWQLDKTAPRMVMGDPKRLRQVLSNLLANAVKFTEKGRVAVTVEADKKSTDALNLHFAVRDTGIGIPPDKQHLIFEAFQQSDTSNTRHFGGIGLGLAVAYQLVSRMGGTLQVESSGIPDEGSVFQFDLTLPLDKTAPPPVEPEVVNHPSLRVLVAEDSPTNQLIAKANLKKVGHDVTVAGNGRIAVEMLTQREFDLVLMDVAMPEMDGLEATMAIREMEKKEGNGRHIPIIAMTAFAMQGYREKCLAAGMDGYVSKPISAGELHKALEPFLDQFRNGHNEPEKAAVPAVSLAKALDIVDQDLDILEMVVEMFPQEYPALIEAIGEALQQGNGAGMEAPAHRLKAVLGSIGSGPAFELAAQLEAMGIAGTAEGGTAVYQQLQSEIQRIVEYYEQTDWLAEATAVLGE